MSGRADWEQRGDRLKASTDSSGRGRIGFHDKGVFAPDRPEWPRVCLWSVSSAYRRTRGGGRDRQRRIGVGSVWSGCTRSGSKKRCRVCNFFHRRAFSSSRRVLGRTEGGRTAACDRVDGAVLVRRRSNKRLSILRAQADFSTSVCPFPVSTVRSLDLLVEPPTCRRSGDVGRHHPRAPRADPRALRRTLWPGSASSSPSRTHFR